MNGLPLRRFGPADKVAPAGPGRTLGSPAPVARVATAYLIRHPATAWSGVRYAGRTDVPLSPAGRRQAAANAAELALRITGHVAIVSSPLIRALEAAQRIAEACRATLVVDPRWREVDFGAAEGATFDELAASWPALAERLLRGERRIDWPIGEPWHELRARVASAWSDLLDAPCDVGIVVSHGGPISVALELALGDAAPAAGAIVGPGEALELAVDGRCQLVRRWTTGR